MLLVVFYPQALNPVRNEPIGFCNRLVKDAIRSVALHSSSLRRTVCTPHSSGFARLASHRVWPACSKWCLSTAW